MIDKLGSPDTCNDCPAGWAVLFKFHRTTREATLRGADADWGRSHGVQTGGLTS